MESQFGWWMFLLMVFPCELAGYVYKYDPPPYELYKDNLLSEYVTPESYEVFITTDIDDPKPYYEGVVIIKVRCSNYIWDLFLHQVEFFNLAKVEIKIGLLGKNDKLGHNVLIEEKKSFDGDRIRLSLKPRLEINKRYQIAIRFSKSFLDSDQAGYVFRSYTKGSVVKHMAFTKFHEFHARRIIPCFDQPNMKATFRLWLEHPKTLTVFSSARFKIAHEIPDKPLWVKDEFHETEKMAPFSLAIALVEFQSPENRRSLNAQIWGMKAITSRVDIIRSMVSRILLFFEKFFKFSHPTKKLEILFLPEVDFQIQESFGIIFMRDTYATDIVEKGNNFDTIDMVTKLCHAVGYQWLGNIVTIDKWQHNWWLQGLNSFLQTVCVGQEFAEYPSNIQESNLVESYTKFLKNEEYHEYEAMPILKSYPNFHPLSNLTEERIYHFIRMIFFILGPEAFYKRLVKYVDKYKYKNSTFLEALDAFSDPPNPKKPKLWPLDYTVWKLRESWFVQDTPLIRVTINREAKLATVTQEVFNVLDVNPYNNHLKGKCWIIPLSYTTKKESRHKDIIPSPRVWCGCEEAKKAVEFPIRDLDQNDWVLVNLDLNVPGRVMYEPENWKAIQMSLLDKEEYKRINVLTRVRILSDMFALAEAGILSYEIVFKTIEYLKHEDEFVVWNVAFTEIDRLRTLLLRTDLFHTYQLFILSILEYVFVKRNFKYYKSVPKGEEVEGNFELALMQSSCKFGLYACHSECLSLFKKWQETPRKEFSLRHPIYKLVLCEHIKNRDKKFFNNFWKTSASLEETYRIPGTTEDSLEAFACSENISMLKTLLEKSLNPEIISRKNSIEIFKFISSNDYGYELMRTFYMNNFSTIQELHPGGETSHITYLEVLLDATNNSEEMNIVMGEFAVEKQIAFSEKSTRKSIRNALRNSEWTERNTQALKKVFRDMNLLKT